MQVTGNLSFQFMCHRQLLKALGYVDICAMILNSSCHVFEYANPVVVREEVVVTGSIVAVTFLC